MSLGHIPSFLASQSHVCFQNGGAGSSECKSNSAAAKKELVWSENAVWTLLDVYEEKWRHLEWGNLKGKHWEDVSTSLSACGQWSYKTPMQCKNKIEDMKKKYKEKLLKGAAGSKWPYFSRMELMFRNASSAKGNTSGGDVAAATAAAATAAAAVGLCSEPVECNNLQSFEQFEEEFDGDEDADDAEDEAEEESENEEVRFQFQQAQNAGNRHKRKSADSGHASFKQQRRSNGAGEVVSAIRGLGELIVRVENSRMESQKKLVLMRVHAENRRMEAELKATEMIINSQLYLAKHIAEFVNDGEDDGD